MSHTKEPWKYTREEMSAMGGKMTIYYNAVQNSEGENLLRFAGTTQGELDARRVVACVNACAGMADPESEVKQLVEYVPALTERMLKAEQQHAELLAKAKKFAQAYDEEAPLFDFYLELMQAIASVESKT